LFSVSFCFLVPPSFVAFLWLFIRPENAMRCNGRFGNAM
jgi:hypothetical protein